ncbi:hypothetical protein ACNQFZ_06590 [Schinkia sp. CFF1]
MKRLRVLLMSVFFTFVFVNSVFAEEYSSNTQGFPFSYFAPEGKGIALYEFGVSDNFTDYSGKLLYETKNAGTFYGGYTFWKGTNAFVTQDVHNYCGKDSEKTGFLFTENSPTEINPESSVALLWVEFCDGTRIDFDNPFAPPDPPDEGSGGDTNIPPSGGNLPPGTDWGAVDTSKPANACGGGRWTSPIRNWVDNIFCPVITFLDLARSKLAAVSLMAGQGLNIGKYLKVFGDLPLSWQLVVSSLLLMVATLGGLLIFRSAMRIYYSLKEGVKWW